MTTTPTQKSSVIIYAGKEYSVDGWFDLGAALSSAKAQNAEIITFESKGVTVTLRIAAGIPIAVEHREQKVAAGKMAAF